MPYRRDFMRRFSGLFFLVSLTLCLWLGESSHSAYLGWGTSVTAQTINPAQLVQQGVDRYKAGEYLASIAPWNAALAEYQQHHDRAGTALVLENLARVYEQVGQTDASIAHWEQLGALYRQANDVPQVGRVAIEQAQAYSRIGQPRKAIALLCKLDPQWQCARYNAIHLFPSLNDATLQVAALGSLGDAYRLTGEYDQAIKNALEPGLQLAKTSNQTAYQRSILNSLGNAYTSLAQVSYRRTKFDDGLKADRQALAVFQESRSLAQVQSDRVSEMRSLMGAMPVYDRIKVLEDQTEVAADAASALTEATKLLNTLPKNQERVYMTLDLAKLLQPRDPVPKLAPAVASRTLDLQKLWQLGQAIGALPRNQCPRASSPPQVEPLLREAIGIARNLEDNRAASFALGALGHLYECRGDYTQALDWTLQARVAAVQGHNAKDSLYVWEWQTGRILAAQKEINPAIQAYERSPGDAGNHSRRYFDSTTRHPV